MPRYRHVAQAESFLQKRHAGKGLLALKQKRLVAMCGRREAVAALLCSRPEKSRQAHKKHRVSPEQEPHRGREGPLVCKKSRLSAASKQHFSSTEVTMRRSDDCVQLCATTGRRSTKLDEVGQRTSPKSVAGCPSSLRRRTTSSLGSMSSEPMRVPESSEGRSPLPRATSFVARLASCTV